MHEQTQCADKTETFLVECLYTDGNLAHFLPHVGQDGLERCGDPISPFCSVFFPIFFAIGTVH